MNIIFFTDKNLHGVSLLENLKAKNIEIQAIVIDQNLSHLSGPGLMKHHIRNSIPTFLLNAFRWLRSMPILEENHQEGFYQKYTSTVSLVPDFNSQICENLVNSLKPDIIILGGARIIKDHILKIPQYGVLNAHPGLLPKYRGIDVIRWAIYHGDPIGVTVHFVNSGVDTGEIIATREITIENGDTVAELKKKAMQIAGELMSEVVKALVQNKQIDSKKNQINEGKQFYKMPPDKVKEVDTILKKYQIEKDN